MKVNRQSWITVLTLTCAVAMMVYGNYRGEATIIFNKAIHICLECIGLG